MIDVQGGRRPFQPGAPHQMAWRYGHWLRVFDKGITLKMGQAPVLNYIDHLIELVKTEKVVLDDIISHTLPLSEVTRGYEMFDKKEEDCVKVVLKPWEQRKETKGEPVKIEN